MNIVVIGAGAMGSVFAAALFESGCPVTLLDTSEPIVESVRRHGLTITGSGGERSVQIPIVARAAELDAPDVAFFFVKAHHTESAAESMRSVLGDDAVVVSLQNGWGNADVLAEFFSPEQIVMGITYNSATVVSPGVVAHTGAGATTLGPYDTAAKTGAADMVAKQLGNAGMTVNSTPTVKDEVWNKLTLNVATLPVSALSRLTAGAMAEGSPVNPLVRSLAAEAVTVGQALGFAVDLDERLDTIETVLQRAGDGSPSMLQDVKGERKTEIEVVCGAVVTEARRLDLPVPLNEAMVDLVHGLERSYLR